MKESSSFRVPINPKFSDRTHQVMVFCKKIFSKAFSKPFLRRALRALDCGHFRAPKDWVLVTSTQEHTQGLSTSFTTVDDSTSFVNPRYDGRLNLIGCFYRERKNLTTMVFIVLVNSKLFAKHIDVYRAGIDS